MASPATMSVPRSTDSLSAMHIAGTCSTYAGIGCYLNRPTLTSTTGAYDASAYKGITFWAKGTGNGGNFIAVGQMASTELEKFGGTCLLSACDGNTFTLKGLSNTVWTQYTVPSTALTGGTVSPFNPLGTWTFEFQFTSGTDLLGVPFELWIDDVSFY